MEEQIGDASNFNRRLLVDSNLVLQLLDPILAFFKLFLQRFSSCSSGVTGPNFNLEERQCILKLIFDLDLTTF